MDQTINWLLTSSPQVEYRTRLDILHQPETDQLVIAARKSMLENPMIKDLLKEITNWPGTILVSHKSAGHSLHKLVFLADIGLTIHDPGMQELIGYVLEHQEPDGPFEMLTNIPTHFGGTGEDVWSWALCDAPSILYALVKFGLGDDPRVKRGIESLAGLVRENGFPCAGSTKLGTFRGPGKKGDPCPYANLIMVKLLAATPQYCDSEACHQAAESLLHCWEERLTFHPYIFYMGNDFCKLKAPLVWFDIIHVSYVLSQLPWLKKDRRLAEMKAIIAQKADADGCFTPESIWTAWKEWDFGQKKAPSPWLTYLATKILND
ncbi:MAG: Phosphate transporter [uncultured bacterium]|nr:MAG: Phosphate transporter [uncultured bacterium]HCS38190.1 hypothetical protein [Anaerolineaceae bacterium]